MISTVTVPMRLSLFGGGSDLYPGGKIISTAISRHIHVVHLPREHGYHLAYSQVEDVHAIHNIKHTLIHKLFAVLHAEPCELHILSELPNSAGLGSSSALSVATVASLRPDWTPFECAKMAYQIERSYKTLGWQDHYGSAFGGTKLMIDEGEDGPFIVRLTDGWDQFIERYVQLWTAPPRTGDAESVLSTYNDDTAPLIRSVDQALDIGPYDVYRLGDLLSKTWEAKKNLSPHVTTLEIERKIQYLLEQGATGAKLCGAGGGGFIMTFAPKKLSLPQGEVKFSVCHTGLTRQ